jgi:hypothetical protein
MAQSERDNNHFLRQSLQELAEGQAEEKEQVCHAWRADIGRALACSWIIFVLLLYPQGYPSRGWPDPTLASPRPQPCQGDED